MITLSCPPRRTDGSVITRLGDAVFGSGYMTVDPVTDQFVVARVDGHLAGFASYDIWDSEDATGDAGFCLGLIDTVAVDSKFRGLRIGDILISTVRSILLQEGVDTIECYATTWADSGICYIKGSLERQGFIATERVPKYGDKAKQSYDCSSCGNPCECEVTIYQLEVNTKQE